MGSSVGSCCLARPRRRGALGRLLARHRGPVDGHGSCRRALCKGSSTWVPSYLPENCSKVLGPSQNAIRGCVSIPSRHHAVRQSSSAKHMAGREHQVWGFARYEQAPVCCKALDGSQDWIRTATGSTADRHNTLQCYGVILKVRHILREVIFQYVADRTEQNRLLRCRVGDRQRLALPGLRGLARLRARGLVLGEARLSRPWQRRRAL